MRLAVWQGASPACDLDLALGQTERALQAAAALGADALVMPEIWWPGYNQPDIAKHAQMQGGALHQSLADLCTKAGCALVFGYAEDVAGQTFNSAFVIGPQGQDLAHYRKIQLYGPREAALYAPGDAYAIFDLAGAKVAILICYDVEFAPHVAALSAAGVTVILAPTANMVPFDHVTRYTVPAMAANHGVTIAYANYCGTEGDLTYAGGSLIVGPHGEVLAQAGLHPALLIADIPAREPARLSTQTRDLRRI
jgi:5-aminopentanamidase